MKMLWKFFFLKYENIFVESKLFICMRNICLRNIYINILNSNNDWIIMNKNLIIRLYINKLINYNEYFYLIRLKKYS